MSGEFAKLFGSNENQVLVKIDTGDKGPEVQFFFKPENLGVCMQSVGFSDNDAGWDKAEAFFESVDATKADLFVKATKDRLGDLIK